MVKFREIISSVEFDFDIEKDKEGNPVLSLVDLQKAYLVGIETYRFPIDLEHVREAVNSAIDRLDIFFKDSLIDDIIENAEEYQEELAEKSSYLPDMLHFISDRKVKGVDYESVRMLEAIVKPYSIDIEEVHKELLKSFPLMRDEVRNYMLKQGTCISYDENGERYIEAKYIDGWLGFERQFQLTYAIRESIDLIDYDEWQALETVFYGERSEALPYYVASEINNILYTELDETPLEFLGKKETEEKKNG